MKNTIYVISNFLINKFSLFKNKSSVDLKRIRMNTQIENYISNAIKNTLNSGVLSADIKNSVHINNQLDIVTLEFSKSPKCYIIVIFKFYKGEIYINIGEMNGGENNILLVKSFFNMVCEFSSSLKSGIEQHYRDYYNLCIQNSITP